MIKFSELGLIEPLQRAVSEENYTHPTPIQEQAIPPLLQGRDLLGCARTGTGKTAAFALPILQRLSSGARAPGRGVRALVLVPTRELAAQVGASFVTYGRQLHCTVAVVYGGVGQGPQVRALSRGVDVLVATPGRLLDLMGQGHVKLERVEVLVLDEADHMLDMGFIPDVRRILATIPRNRQTLFFSATMPPPIAALADKMLTKPVKIVVTPAASTVESVAQSVHFVSRADKPALLARMLADPAVTRALVFTRTKRGADKVMRRLTQDGISAEAIHGNKSQGARERSLAGFRNGRTRVLVATDIAARGIDVDDVTHVINFELPNVPESYVHRIGRTARAGASGVAISLCEPEEREYLRDIEKLIQRSVAVVGGSERAGYARGDRPNERARSERKPHSHGAPSAGRGRSTRGYSGRQRAGARIDNPVAARRHAPDASRSSHAPSRGGGHATGHVRTGAPSGRNNGSHAARRPDAHHGHGHARTNASPRGRAPSSHRTDGGAGSAFGEGIGD